MNALVTGASGFTGTVLTEQLLKEGHQVRVMVRDKDKLKPELRTQVEIIQGDIVDRHCVEKSVAGIERVFHVAALFRQAGIRDQFYWDVNVQGTQNLLQASLEAGAKRFVHCSTVGVHGHIENPPADETYRFDPGDIYQVTKLQGERTALEFGKNTGLPVTVVRPGPIYGPGDLRLLKLFKLALAKFTPVIGNGKIFFNMVYVEDLANLFILAAEHDDAPGEVFIGGGGENITLNEIVDIISGLVGKPSRKIYLPAKPFQLLGTLCENICIPLKIEPPIYRRRVDFFTKSRSFDISKARKLLGFKSKFSIHQGLANTLHWYQQEGLV